MKLEFSGQIFEKHSNIKFHENPSNGRRVIPCGRTDITNLIVAFRKFANASHNTKTSVMKCQFKLKTIRIRDQQRNTVTAF